MVDAERVERLLERIRADLRVLQSHAVALEAVAADRTRLDAVKYGFVVVVEGCARLAHHLLASEGWPVADTNADAFRRLAEHDVLTPRTAGVMTAAVGFRNILVHRYAEVDDEKVVAFLARLDEFDDYVTQLARWLASTDG